MTRFPTKIQSRPLFIGLGLVWAIVAASGLGWLMKYQMTPGKAAAALVAWPGAGVLKLAADRPTLLMFVHPECSCSRASIGELQELMTVCKDRVAAHVLFFKPGNQSEDWSHTDLWNDAHAIGGVEVGIDLDGRLARIFGAKTSGQVLVYTPQGRLTFSGGITDGRGHFGDNAGLDAAMAIVRCSVPAASDVVTSNVYGCEITSSTPAIASEANRPSVENKP
jgi:hypothetical protein